MIDIDRVIKDFKVKLEKMEKYIIYIQERYNYFENLNSDVKLNLKEEGELKNIKESLDRKIESFHDCIKTQKLSRSIESYFEVKESYDQIKVTVFEVFKIISDLLHERRVDKLLKIIDEDLTIVYKKNEKLEEETKEELKEEIKEGFKKKKDFLKPPDIFDKKLDIMVADYLSTK